MVINIKHQIFYEKQVTIISYHRALLFLLDGQIKTHIPI